MKLDHQFHVRWPTPQRVVAYTLAGIGALIALFGGYILAGQFRWYLRYGTWVELPLSVVFTGPTTTEVARLLPWRAERAEPGSIGAWLLGPDEWVGLHGLVAPALDWISLPTPLLVIGILVFFTARGAVPR